MIPPRPCPAAEWAAWISDPASQIVPETPAAMPRGFFVIALGIFIGVPKEGRGYSKGARGRFGPPSFDDAVFTMGDADLTIRIQMTY